MKLGLYWIIMMSVWRKIKAKISILYSLYDNTACNAWCDICAKVSSAKSSGKARDDSKSTDRLKTIQNNYQCKKIHCIFNEDL